ncbi:MAG: hypothetical protein GY753_08690 [Gammaproteobacteria bacterium]|nr:hypothetical protein [Gammaproteobacteria bacterium]
MSVAPKLMKMAEKKFGKAKQFEATKGRGGSTYQVSAQDVMGGHFRLACRPSKCELKYTRSQKDLRELEAAHMARQREQRGVKSSGSAMDVEL